MVGCSDRWISRQICDVLKSLCKKQPNDEIVTAILASAVRRDGSPKFGILSDKQPGGKRDHPNKIILGDPSLSCASYNKNLDDLSREALVTGYFNGTEAYRITMKQRPDLPWHAWPLGTKWQDMKLILDKICTDPKNSTSTIRDILWVSTTEIAIKQDSAKR